MLKALAVHLVARFAAARHNMPAGCIFCRIVSGDAQAAILYQDELVTAFRDIHPVAPTHILIVPNAHIESVNAVLDEHAGMLGHLFTAARDIARQEGLSEGGYRLITNTGPHGGQTVPHLHLHLIGGRPMRYPMG